MTNITHIDKDTTALQRAAIVRGLASPRLVVIDKLLQELEDHGLITGQQNAKISDELALLIAHKMRKD